MTVIIVILLFFAGLIIGLSGIGGFLFPPLVISLFNVSAREAIATCLGSFIMLSISGSMVYLRKGHVNFKYVYLILIGAIPGVLSGFIININLDDLYLRFSLAILLLFISVLLGMKFLRRKAKLPYSEMHLLEKAITGIIGSKYALIVAGAVGGVMAGFLGVGGPVVTIPFMVFAGYSSKDSIGSSMFSCIFIVAFAFLIQLSYVNVNITYIFMIGGLGAFGSWCGAKITGIIKQDYISIFVGGVTVLSAISILYNL